MDSQAQEMVWLCEIYPDKETRDRTLATLGGCPGIHSIYNNLHESTLGAFQAAVKVQLETIDTKRQVIELQGQLAALRHQLEEFQYSEGKITQHHNESFEKAVKRAYKVRSKQKNVPTLSYCPVTKAYLPDKTVVVTHLFKQLWRDQTHLVGIEDIDDPRNGLPIWRPIEWAFNASRMCFIYDKVSDSLMSKLLDPSLRPIKLSEKGRALMGQKWIEPGGDLSQLTYGDVDGKALKFIAGNLHRPLKRVLNFQARNARIFAKDNGWISDSWDFEDFEDEGLSVTDKVERWLISV